MYLRPAPKSYYLISSSPDLPHAGKTSSILKTQAVLDKGMAAMRKLSSHDSLEYAFAALRPLSIFQLSSLAQR